MEKDEEFDEDDKESSSSLILMSFAFVRENYSSIMEWASTEEN